MSYDEEKEENAEADFNGDLDSAFDDDFNPEEDDLMLDDDAEGGEFSGYRGDEETY